jgi:adenylate kinase family enzyme
MGKVTQPSRLHKTQKMNKTKTASPPLPRAILLIGPTGSGKTPFGEYVEKEGLQGRRCSHFDFGAVLRKTDAAGTPHGNLTSADINFIGKVLTEGALLENEKFYIAAELLKNHITENSLVAEDLILLNGLPRHIGQARDLDDIVSIEGIIQLHCTPATVYNRIRQNSGGDRTNRNDDSPAEITAKLTIFENRTRPIINHYAKQNIPTVTVEITTATAPADILSKSRSILQK